MQQKIIHMLAIKNQSPVWEGLDEYNSSYYWEIRFDLNGVLYETHVYLEYNQDTEQKWRIYHVYNKDKDNFSWDLNEIFKGYDDYLDQFKSYIGGFPQRIHKCERKLDVPDELVVFVIEIFGDEDFDIINWDMDRISVGRNNTEYMIRMWNITEKQIEWTLYKVVKHKGGGDHVENEGAGTFYQ